MLVPNSVIGKGTNLEDRIEKKDGKNRSSYADLSKDRGFGQFFFVSLKEVLKSSFANEEEGTDCREDSHRREELGCATN